MFRYEIKYTDFNDNEQTELLRFHMTVDEFARIKGLIPNDLEEKAKEWQNNEKNDANYDDLVKVVDSIKNIVLDAYGEVSEDGKRFIKSDEIKNNFYRSAAYAALIDEFLINPELLTSFVNNIAPKAAKK